MALDEKAVGAAITTLTYGLTGVLSMIPQLQEIGLDRKLNEDKTKLEKNGFHPDLVARHVQNNGAVFIGCGQDTLDLVRQGLTQAGVPFITITSSMIEDESKRPPYFYTVIIRDIDGQRAADLLKDLLQEHGRETQGYEEELEEEDLEREIGGQEDVADRQVEDAKQQEEDSRDWQDEEEEGEKEDGSEDDEKKVTAKKKAEKRKERRRAEERKRQDDRRREDSLKQDEVKRHEQVRVYSGLSYNSEGYREAYAIRATEIEAQCERYAKVELMRRELERMRLSGEDTSDAYSQLKDQYRSTNDEIQVYHDNFQSIGKGGWKEYAAEAAERARNASTEDLRECTWDIPDSNDYLRRNQDGSFSAYNREEKKAYLDRKYQGGEANITLNGYAEDAIRHEALRRQEELLLARENTGTQYGMEQYQALLGKYDVTDQEVKGYHSWDSVRREKKATERKLDEAEKQLEGQGYTGVREYREKLEDVFKDTPTKDLVGQVAYGGYRVQAAPDPSASIKEPDGKPVIDFRDRKFSRPAYESLEERGSELMREKLPIAFSRACGEDVPLKQMANGYTLKAIMEPQQNGRPYATSPQSFGAQVYHAQPEHASSISGAVSAGGVSPMCGGILISSGVHAISPDLYRRKGSTDQEAFQTVANTQPAAMAKNGVRASSMFTSATERVHAASENAISIGTLQGKSDIAGTGDRLMTTSVAQAIRRDSLKRVEAANSRASHAALNMAKNRYFAMMAKQGVRTAVQASVEDTEAGRMAMSAMYAVKLPAHMVKQQFLNVGRTAIDQGDVVMTALNSHIIRTRAEAACAMGAAELEKFSMKSGIGLSELKAVQSDRQAMERLVAWQYGGTFKVPGKDDMEGVIRAIGIQGDLKEGSKVGTEDILAFLEHHKQSTLAERSRALKGAEEVLDGLTGSQKRLVESLFSQEKFMGEVEMKAFLTRNGISEDLAGRLAGGNWATNEDILAALRQVGISRDKAGALMESLKGVSMEDRAAMMGMFQLYAGDSLDGFDMDKFRGLLNVLDVDQGLKDELNNNFMHLSHLSMGDIKRLLVKYKGSPEAEAFLNRLLNERICLTLGRNREMSRFELLNGMENILFKMAQGTDAMSGFNQVMSLGRGMTRATKSGYRLLYNMVFRRMTSPISIGKLKVTPANLTGTNMKAAAVNSVKQTRVAATFSKMLNRRMPAGLRRAANHAMHPGKFIGRTVMKKVELILARHGIDVAAAKAGVQLLAAKATAATAALSEILLVVVVIILIIIALLMAYESIDLGSNDTNNYSAAYVSAADGKDAFVQEVVDMLRGYTDGFIDELNNAQYNRGMYSGMDGYNVNEGVAAFEAGAYQVVFRGPDGEPIDDITSVDLNNSKDIISMASVFIPTVFNKPADSAPQKVKEEYEKDKEHFMDYCTFLWAASHQISIEEYHPGNATNPDADDTSGLVTDAQTGKCQMDFATGGNQGAGVNWWIGTGAAPTSGEICEVCKKADWYEEDKGEHACVVKPAADPCTHGHWQIVTTAITHKGCNGHHHSCSKHDYWYSCSEKGKMRWDKNANVYKRVWVCDGHMGAVVYATIGRISRMPNFGAAKDYDYDNPETYGGSGGIYSYFGGTGGEGQTAFHGDSYSLTDVQLKYLAAMCMGEQRVCATNEVTMRYQASLMVNVYELYGKRKGLSLYEYLTLLPTQKKNGVSGWFATTSHTYADKNAGSVTPQALEWIKDVICNGNRITKANEQGTLVTGFVKAVYQGKEYTGNAMKNESIYVPGETILYTSGGQACLFEAFPGGHPAGCGTPVVDPFAIIIN